MKEIRKKAQYLSYLEDNLNNEFKILQENENILSHLAQLGDRACFTKEICAKFIKLACDPAFIKSLNYTYSFMQ